MGGLGPYIFLFSMLYKDDHDGIQTNIIKKSFVTM